jgi:hypothetical protein
MEIYLSVDAEKNVSSKYNLLDKAQPNDFYVFHKCIHQGMDGNLLKVHSLFFVATHTIYYFDCRMELILHSFLLLHA